MKTIIWAVIFVLFTSNTHAYKHEDMLRDSLVQTLMDQGITIMAMQSWNVEHGPLLCIYSKEIDDSTGRSWALTFYQLDSSRYIEIFRYNTGCNFVSFYQTCEYRGNLLTVWIAGSAYHYTIFSFIEGKVVQTVDCGSKIRPEIIFKDFESEYEILVTHKSWDKDKKTGEDVYLPDYTTIYKWNKDHYDAIEVPYKKRFDVKVKKK